MSRPIRWRIGVLGGAAVAAAALSSCSSSTTSPSTPTPSAPPAASSASASGSGSGSGSTVSCGAVKAAADELDSTIDKWKAGDATRNEVSAAVQNLGQAVASQARAAGQQASAPVSSLSSAVTALVDTVTKSGVTDGQIEVAAWAVVAAASTISIPCQSGT